jgi:hypothetical protein
MVLPIVAWFLGGVSQAPTQRTSKASPQFQLLSREKGAFQSSTGVEVNFLVLCGFLDRRTRVGNELLFSRVLLRGNRSQRQRIIRLLSIGHAENRNETVDLIICTEYWQEKKNASKQKSLIGCGWRKRGG